MMSNQTLQFCIAYKSTWTWALYPLTSDPEVQLCPETKELPTCFSFTSTSCEFQAHGFVFCVIPWVRWKTRLHSPTGRPGGQFTSGSDDSWEAGYSKCPISLFCLVWFGCWRTFSILVHSPRTTNNTEKSHRISSIQIASKSQVKSPEKNNPLLKKTCTFCALQLLWKPIILLPWHLP